MVAKKSIYASIPAVSKKGIAGSNPVGKVSIGGDEYPGVPKRQSSIHGLNVPPHTFKGANIKGAHSYGRVAKMKTGRTKIANAPKGTKKTFR